MVPPPAQLAVIDTASSGSLRLADLGGMPGARPFVSLLAASVPTVNGHNEDLSKGGLRLPSPAINGSDGRSGYDLDQAGGVRHWLGRYSGAALGYVCRRLIGYQVASTGSENVALVSVV